MSPDRWIFITAGLGNSNFEDAAIRLLKDVNRFQVFESLVYLNNNNIESLCPTVSKKYKKFLRANVRGFGFMSWKAEIIHRTLDSNPEAGIIWADCGCEAIVNCLTKRSLVHKLNRASKEGYIAFNLNTEEYRYTKRELFDFFPILSSSDKSPQFQTTFFGLHGDLGRKIAKRWFEVVSAEISTVNEISKVGEQQGFVCHRHDQSVFSLVMKELNLEANMKPIRSGKTMRSQILSKLHEPFIASRNRSGLKSYK